MKNKKVSGIYEINNLKSGKKYIGQTVDLEKRSKEHFRYLRGGYHYNSHLQNSWDKYGKNSFEFKILLYCEPFELTKYEQFFVDSHERKKLYNIRLDCVNSPLGTVHSEETKRLFSLTRSGENNPNWKKVLSEETKRKISQNHADMSGKNNPRYGKHHSKESRKKISQNHADVSGENNPSSKLTKKDVFLILKLYYNDKRKQNAIAKLFSVYILTVHNICNGKTWKKCYNEFMETYKNE